MAYQYQLAHSLGAGSHQLGEQLMQLAAVFRNVQAGIVAHVQTAHVGFLLQPRAEAEVVGAIAGLPDNFVAHQPVQKHHGFARPPIGSRL
ncbi:hypothetical protein EI290_04915 [Hymenobacter metallilatus]|uniref:Uncharacterized protein n=1 Tax=Hymenobacter metallilatus TaxID=2493666 RepID=A0A428JRD8_9BACT|nr:hypothetical protein EI290_04915 [Hymenobacter metallilatus]